MSETWVIAQARRDAEMAFINEITELVPRVKTTKALLDLAEAMAWVTNPGQPHSGSVTVKR